MRKKIVIAVFVLGLLVLGYGLFAHRIEILGPEATDQSIKLAESNMIRNISFGVVKVDRTGTIQQTQKVDEKAAGTCPT